MTLQPFNKLLHRCGTCGEVLASLPELTTHVRLHQRSKYIEGETELHLPSIEVANPNSPRAVELRSVGRREVRLG